MITRFYADILEDRSVRCVAMQEDPDEGPPSLPVYIGVECAYVGTTFAWNQPSPTHKPTWPPGATSIVWVETLTIDQLKVARKAKITADRIAADTDHFTFTYNDSTGASVSKEIRTADKDMFDVLVADSRIKKGFPLNWPGGWKAIDNSYVPISSVEQWDVFFIAMYDAGIANFNHSQALKNDIDNATTAEQIDAIVW